MGGVCRLDQTECDLIENAYNGCCEATEKFFTMEEISNNHGCGRGTAFDNNAGCIPNSRQNNKEDCEALKAAFKQGDCCEMHSSPIIPGDGETSHHSNSDECASNADCPMSNECENGQCIW
tara:strand:+ start:241 stop:603 length:363 start_codon:yes stop_codon:yes gene_type:complete